MHRSHQVLRSAVVPVSTRINSLLSTPPYATTGDVESVQAIGQFETGTEYDPNFEAPEAHTSFNSTTTLQPAPPFNEPVPLCDVRAIQNRVVGVFDALQTSDHMSPAELSLIKTVRETASDPDIMSKIVNNGSFQEFMMYVPSLLGEQHAQIASSSSSITGLNLQHPLVFDEYESEGEYIAFAHRSSVSSSSSGTTDQYESDSDEESAFLRARSRRMHNEAEHNSVVQQRALNRLNELCHQISPDFSTSPATRRNPDRLSSPVSEYSSYLEPGVSKPTMEGPGMPGLAQPAVPEQPPSPAPQWTNPVYLFVITACVIPITILAVTAVVYPSPKTWSLLRSGFKAVCNKILA